MTDAECIKCHEDNGGCSETCEELRFDAGEARTSYYEEHGYEPAYNECPSSDDNHPMYEDWGVC